MKIRCRQRQTPADGDVPKKKCVRRFTLKEQKRPQMKQVRQCHAQMTTGFPHQQGPRWGATCLGAFDFFFGKEVSLSRKDTLPPVSVPLSGGTLGGGRESTKASCPSSCSSRSRRRGAPRKPR